jgi:eukaryotic-like serine/threonine-protein kinase
MKDQMSVESLGRYQIVNLLGEGGMGIVYHAYDPRLQREVALKVIHPHLLRRPGVKERFLQEARAAARLTHPGIVQVYDTEEANGVMYIVMAFIQGSNLQELLEKLKRKGERVMFAQAIELVQQVSLAVDHAHRNGVLHRDIKPANIMLAPEPYGGLPFRPIITDLGLAKLVEGGIETQSGALMGTPAYMSPEQAMGQTVDIRSDVYSLGALLYHLCVGQPPFPASTISDIIRVHVKEQQPPAPRSLNPAIPHDLEAVTLKALERDPIRRYPDAGQLAQALGELLPREQPQGQAAPVQLDRTAMDSKAGVSLATLLEGNQASHRGKSINDEFPKEQPNTGTDCIQVLEPEKTARAVPVKTQVICVGREADNQIVLNDPKVSRYHLRIERVGSGYQVTDQGSSNGTFLSGVRLLKGLAKEWTAEEPLQIGDTYLKLVIARQASGLKMESEKRSPTRLQESGARLKLKDAQMMVEAGNSLPLELIIDNQSNQVDHYQLRVVGIPPDWIKNLPKEPLKCMPGQEQKLTLFFQPPRSSQSRAGHHPFSLQAASQAKPGEIFTANANLTIAPYQQFAVHMHPESIRADKASRVQVTNQGNMSATFQIEWSDPADELVFDPPKTTLTLGEGQTSVVEFRGRLRQARLTGGEQSHHFNTMISSSNAQPQMLPGEFISRGMLPVWLLPMLFIAMCLFLSIGAGAFYSLVYLPNIQGTKTAVAAEAQQATKKYAVSEDRQTITPTFKSMPSNTLMNTPTSAPESTPTSTSTPIPTSTPTATSTSIPTPTPTSTFDETATKQASDIAEALSQYQTAMLNWHTVLYDTFDSNNGWRVINSIEDTYTFSQQITSGEYIFDITTKDNSVSSWDDLSPVKGTYDVYLTSIDVKVDPSSSMDTLDVGMQIWQKPSRDNLWLDISSLSNVPSLGAYIWTDPSSNSKSPFNIQSTSIDWKQNQFNRISVLSTGNSIIFFINGNYIAKANNASFALNSFVPYAGIYKNSRAHVEFDNASLRVP